MDGEVDVMATISRKAIQWMQDEVEYKDSRIDELEEELEAALEDNAALRAALNRAVTTE